MLKAPVLTRPLSAQRVQAGMLTAGGSSSSNTLDIVLGVICGILGALLLVAGIWIGYLLATRRQRRQVGTLPFSCLSNMLIASLCCRHQGPCAYEIAAGS